MDRSAPSGASQLPYSAKKGVFIFSFSGLQGREGPGRDGPGDEPGGEGTVQGRSGLERGSSREWERGSREGLPANF